MDVGDSQQISYMYVMQVFYLPVINQSINHEPTDQSINQSTNRSINYSYIAIQ